MICIIGKLCMSERHLHGYRKQEGRGEKERKEKQRHEEGLYTARCIALEDGVWRSEKERIFAERNEYLYVMSEDRQNLHFLRIFRPAAQIVPNFPFSQLVEILYG